MRCSECGHPMKTVRRERRWSVGDHLFLRRCTIARCAKCGEESYGGRTLLNFERAIARWLLTRGWRTPEETTFVRRALGLGADRFKPVSVVTDLHSVETRFVVHTACCQVLKLRPLRFDRVLELFARADAKFNPKVVRVRL